jgi:hypothetical protein
MTDVERAGMLIEQIDELYDAALDIYPLSKRSYAMRQLNVAKAAMEKYRREIWGALDWKVPRRR